MPEQVFYRKWRPQRFADVVGQEYVTQTLLNALATGRVAHAYLFCGSRGTGKTSTGRILAKAVNCLRNGKGEPCNECSVCQGIAEGRAMDLIEIDAASNRGIDEIRSLREKVSYAPNEARYKLYIIDEVHMLTDPAFNALLKTLEEPPPHAIFVLATTEPHRLPPTVISRCQRFDFRRIALSGIVGRLARLCQDEDIQAGAEVLGAIARASGGSLRDAENLLEQLATGYGRELGLQHLNDLLGLGGEAQVRVVAMAALSGDVARGLAAVGEVASEGLDLRQFHRQLMEYLRGLLLVKAGAGETVELPQEEIQELRQVAAGESMERIVRAVKLFAEGARGNSSAPLPLELALVEAASSPTQEVNAVAPQPGPVRMPSVQAPPQRQPAAPISSPREAGPKEAVAGSPAPQVDKLPEPSPPAAGGSDPEPVAATGDGPADSQALFHLKANWKAVIEASRGKGQKFKMDALLRSACEPVSVEQETVVLGFSHQFLVDRMREEMENPASRRALEEALGEVLGERRQVRCIVMSRERKESGGHLVKAAVEMGARVVEEGGPKNE